jgi:hypothetical protein
MERPLDLVGGGKMGLGREIRPGSRGLEWAASHGVPRVAFVGDCALSVLCFASACAVAGLRSGVGELGRVLDISRRSPYDPVGASRAVPRGVLLSRAVRHTFRHVRTSSTNRASN